MLFGLANNTVNFVLVLICVDENHTNQGNSPRIDELLKGVGEALVHCYRAMDGCGPLVAYYPQHNGR